MGDRVAVASWPAPLGCLSHRDYSRIIRAQLTSVDGPKAEGLREGPGNQGAYTYPWLLCGTSVMVSAWFESSRKTGNREKKRAEEAVLLCKKAGSIHLLPATRPPRSRRAPTFMVIELDKTTDPIADIRILTATRLPTLQFRGIYPLRIADRATPG